MPRYRTLLTGGAIAIAVVAGLVLAGLYRLHANPSGLAGVLVIDLAQAPGRFADWRIGRWSFTDWQLSALKSDRNVCRAVLLAPHVDMHEVSDFAGSDGCGWTNAVRLAGAGGVRMTVDAISCELTAALALWLAHDVQPIALQMFGERVVALQHRGSYSCRNIRGNPANAHIRSEHARANALDIASFQLASGRQVSVLKSWGRDDRDARFLAEVHRRACRYFRVAIGPAYNAAHRDHFHFDRGPYSACR